MDRTHYTVVDTKDVKPGEQCPVLGQFESEEAASAFIGTLPEAESGRYGIDGPGEDQVCTAPGCKSCESNAKDQERAEMKPSPLESSPDAAAEWDIDARMAEAAGDVNKSWEVVVGNIGTVYRGGDGDHAETVYDDYVAQSGLGTGRAAGESVTLLHNDQIVKESVGDLDSIKGVVTSSAGCSCATGLGKYEGEPVHTFLLQELSEPDEEESIGEDGGWWGLYRYPVVLGAEVALEMARSFGYCDPCIADALQEMALAKEGGAILHVRSDGFVDGTFFDGHGRGAKGLDEAWAKVQREVVEANGPQDDDWVTEDFVTFYKSGYSPRKVMCEVPEGCCWKCIVVYEQEQDKYWPNVWSVSDHGNVSLLTVSDQHEHV